MATENTHNGFEIRVLKLYGGPESFWARPC